MKIRKLGGAFFSMLWTPEVAREFDKFFGYAMFRDPSLIFLKTIHVVTHLLIWPAMNLVVHSILFSLLFRLESTFGLSYIFSW